MKKLSTGERLDDWRKITKIIKDCDNVITSLKNRFCKQVDDSLSLKSFKYLSKNAKNIMHNQRMFIEEFTQVIRVLFSHSRRAYDHIDIILNSETLFEYKNKLSKMLKELQVIFDKSFERLLQMEQTGSKQKNKFIQNDQVVQKFRIDKMDFFNLNFKQVLEDERKLRLIESEITKLSKSIKNFNCSIKAREDVLKLIEKYFFLVEQIGIDYGSKLKNYYKKQQNKIKLHLIHY